MFSTFLVPAYPGCPEKVAIKQVSVWPSLQVRQMFKALTKQAFYMPAALQVSKATV